MSSKAAAGWRKDFVWGVSTSSYQIEGAHNVDGRAPSIWTPAAHRGQVRQRRHRDDACDHYHRYPRHALMRGLGLDPTVSVAWPGYARGKGRPNVKGWISTTGWWTPCSRPGSSLAVLYQWTCRSPDDLGGWTNATAPGGSDYAA
jgi:beta-glucosidase